MVSLAVIAGCSPEPSSPVRNEPPFVRITGGPLDGSRASYTARIYWAGWDNDGIIDHYEYALDPPPGFTEDEIAHPETSPGVAIETIFGPGGRSDTLRVSKIVDGELLTFDWVETVEFSRAFAFTTPLADSLVQGGSLGPDETFSGVHAAYVRAQDNQGLYSSPDRIGYTAFTFTPSSEIVRPNVETDISNLGPVLTVKWDGLDPDGESADKKPTGYIYKLLRLDTLEPPIPISAVNSPNILYSKGGDTWVFQPADTVEKALNLGTPGQYVFGVRAVDQAGAVEPFLNWGRNAFKFQAFANGGRPILTVSEPSLGTFTFRGTGDVKSVDVPTGNRLRFRWSATAEDYGGTIEGFSYGLDVPDLDQEGPGSGWGSWGISTGNVEPIVFDRPGTHVLYIRVRDVAGALTLATLVLRVIEFAFDREVLYVDDSYDDLFPRDSEHDAFWRNRFLNYGRFPEATVFEYHAFGTDDRGTTSPGAPSLEELGRYRLILWECRGSGFGGKTALLRATNLQRTLASYLSTGGKLWLGGRMTVAATTPTDAGVTGDLNYPKENLKAGDFAYDFLKLHSTRINNNKGQDPRSNLARVTPFPGRPEVYPRMDIDPAKLNLAQLAPSHADAVFDPIFAESEPDFRGVVDSLYVYGAAGNILLNGSSAYHNRLTGIRWYDPDPGRLQGRIQWFGFSMYYFLDGEAQETFNRSMDWFREEELATDR